MSERPVREFRLPKPPSTNALYSGRRFKTQRYNTWIRAAGWSIVEQQGAGGRPPPLARFALCVWMPWTSRADLDNIKAIPDLLVEMGVIADDGPGNMCELRVMRHDDADVRVKVVPV